MSTYRLFYRLEGNNDWQSLPLEPGEFSIGRLSDNQLCIEDHRMSRHHARLRVQDNQVWIVDLNSSNGVTVNGARIPQNQWIPLPAGASAALGPLTIRVEPAQASPGVVARPAAAPTPPAQPPIQPPPQFLQRPAPQPNPVLPPPPANVRNNPPAPMPPRPAAGQSPQPSHTSRRRSKAPIIFGFVALALCLCLVAVAGLAWKFYPQIADFLPGGGFTLGEDQPFSPDPPEVIASHTLSTSSGAFIDESGVQISITSQALPPEEVLTVETANLGKGMLREIEKGYTVDTPVFSVTAGQNDGSGRVSFSLPAASPDSRLAVLVDDQFLAVLPTLPQNGILSVEPFIGAPGAIDGYPSLAQATIPNRYFVITPKQAQNQLPDRQGRVASLAEEPDIVSCIPLIWHGNRCWTNKAGSVTVLFWNTEMPTEMYTADPLRPPEVIDGIIRNVAQAMSIYQKEGFTNAAISSSNSVYVIISAKETEPSYSQKTGNIYLGWSVVNEISSGQGLCTLAHELFHWIEDDAYLMNAAALDNHKAWWLEMGAENGSFMIDQACLGRTLSTYGLAESGSSLAWQVSPFHWDWTEGSRYIQALQMYISICEGGSRCMVSPAEFARLINSGEYPSSASHDNYYRNADDMGRYLLGNAPLLSRSSAVIPQALKVGTGYGDYIHLKLTNAPIVDFSLNESRIKATGDLEATAETTISHGGVYPLWISNGKGTPTGGGNGFTSLPGILTISPGTPLWYSLDNGAPIFFDGSKELVLGSISDKLGIGLVRLVGTAPDSDKTFKAVIKPVDLSGDWANRVASSTIVSMNCPDSEDPPEVFDIVTFLSGYGTFEPDPAAPVGTHYIWSGQVPDSEGVSINAEVTVAADKITLTYLVDVPRPTTESLLPWLPARTGRFIQFADPFPLWPNLLMLVIVAGGFFLTAGLRRKYPVFTWARVIPLTLLMITAGFWLSSCFGFALWGTFSGTYTYSTLKIPEPIDPAAAPQELEKVKWMLDGKGDIQYDLHMLITTEDENGNTVENESPCQVRFDAVLQGLVGSPDFVPEPSSQEGD